MVLAKNLVQSGESECLGSRHLDADWRAAHIQIDHEALAGSAGRLGLPARAPGKMQKGSKGTTVPEGDVEIPSPHMAAFGHPGPLNYAWYRAAVSFSLLAKR